LSLDGRVVAGSRASKENMKVSFQPRNKPISIHMHDGDIPNSLGFSGSVAIDTETQGLNPLRDRLCLMQLSAGDGHCHLVQFTRKTFNAPNLKKLLKNPNVVKLFHFARFDLAIIKQNLNTLCTPVYCTKVASKLVRTYTERHGLKDLTKELLGIDISKEQQSSDWARNDLTDAQKNYAAIDVLNLHIIKHHLDLMLEREKRNNLAEDCFKFLPTQAMLDLTGWGHTDIFSH